MSGGNSNPIIPLFFAVSLGVFLPSVAAGQHHLEHLSNQTIETKNLTGTVRFDTPTGKTFVVSRGEQMPFVPYGSKISVLSGKAELAVREARMLLESGQSIRIARDQAAGTVQITAAYDSVVPVRLEIDQLVILLYTVGKVAVGVDTAGIYEITALSGDVYVLTANGERKLAPGETLKANRGFVPEPAEPMTEEASPYAE